MKNKQPTGIEEELLYERIMTPEGYAYEPVDMQKLIETTRREAVELDDSNLAYKYKDEWYGYRYKCPKCGEGNIWGKFKYCPDCGSPISFRRPQ